MKKYLIIPLIMIVIIGVLFQTIISPNLGRAFHHTFTKSIDLNDEKVEGLKLFDNIYSDEIVSEYGIQTIQSRNVTNYNYFDLRKGIEVASNNKGEILRFIVTDKNLETSRGIKIGDNNMAVKTAYGNNHYYRREQGANVLGYIDKARNISMEFWMHDNNVVFIRLDDTSMS